MKKLTVAFSGLLMGMLLLPQANAKTQTDQHVVVCYEREDRNMTRVLMNLTAQGRISSLEVVTPEYEWDAPGQPETPRFPAGKSDVSSNLIEKMKSGAARVTAVRDGDGELNLVRFAATSPDSLDVEGFRGSVAILDSYVNGKAPAALYYTGTDNINVVIGLECSKHSK